MFTYLQRFRNILFFSLSRDKDRDYRSGLSAAKWRGSVGKFYCYSLKSVTSNQFFFFFKWYRRWGGSKNLILTGVVWVFLV